MKHEAEYTIESMAVSLFFVSDNGDYFLNSEEKFNSFGSPLNFGG